MVQMPVDGMADRNCHDRYGDGDHCDGQKCSGFPGLSR
jgi:hypothetical protein